VNVNTICKILINKDKKALMSDLNRIKGIGNLKIDIKPPYYSDYNGEKIYNGGTGYISFDIKIYNNKYSFSSFIINQNLDYSKDSCTEPFINDQKFLYFSAGQNPENIKILEYITSHFGGYITPVNIDEDDEGNAFNYKVKKTRKLNRKFKYDDLVKKKRKNIIKSFKKLKNDEDNSEMFF